MIKHAKDSAETKERILAAAKRIFAEKGFSGARMSGIAELAGVNQALIHYHFSSKEMLYKTLFHRFMGNDSEKMMRLIIEEIKSWNEKPQVELCAVLYLIISIHTETHDNDIQKIISREVADGKGLLNELVREYIIPTLEQIEEIIKRGIGEGVFETANPLLFVLNMVIFTADYLHAEDLLKDTKLHKKLYSNKKDTLYSFMRDQTFKALRPENKKVSIPSLNTHQTERMDYFVKQIKSRKIAVI
jgi:AcrR family transcriptional regulator